MMVMVEPTRGLCDHGCCKICYGSWLAKRRADGLPKTCPVCRDPVTEKTLGRIRSLEEEIAEARVFCKNAGGTDEHATKRFKISVSAAAEQGSRGLETRGCSWRGLTGELWGHIEHCEFEVVVCARRGCGESVLRKEVAEHNETTCASRPVPCTHCNAWKVHSHLAEHEGRCPRATVPCPHEGCGVSLVRKDRRKHREGCEFEKVKCPFPGCEVKMLRAEMDAHVNASMGEHNWRALMDDFSRKNREIAELNGQIAVRDAVMKDPHKFVDGSVIRKEFTWSANGWSLVAVAGSECQLFCKGVSASCDLRSNFVGAKGTHRLSLEFLKLSLRVWTVTAFSILDQNDEPIVFVNMGSAASPSKSHSKTHTSWGSDFTPTNEVMARTLREDGSIKLRAVVDVYLLDHPKYAVKEPASPDDGSCAGSGDSSSGSGYDSG